MAQNGFLWAWNGLEINTRVCVCVSQGGFFIFYLFDENVVVRLCAEECVCVCEYVCMCVCVCVCVAIISWGNRLKLQKPESAVRCGITK